MIVGQDLLRMESGGEPTPKEEASSEAKEPASKEQSTSSDPKPEQSTPSKEQNSAPAPPKEEKKAPAPAPKKAEPKASQSEGSSTPTVGNREERRVCNSPRENGEQIANGETGQDEPHAPENRRASEAVAEHCRFLDDL